VFSQEGAPGEVSCFSGVIEVFDICFCKAGSIDRRELWGTNSFWSAALEDFQVDRYLLDFACLQFLFQFLHLLFLIIVQVVQYDSDKEVQQNLMGG